MAPEKPIPAPKSPAPAAAAAVNNVIAHNSPMTAKQRRALFDSAAQGMTPERIKPKPVDPVLAWIPQIVRKHKEGFSPRQIVAMAAAPGIELKLSERAVQRIVADHEKQATAQAGASGQ